MKKKYKDQLQNLFKNEFSLEKSAKDYKAMLGGDVSQHQEAFDTAKKMPNSNWGQWVIRNYKQNPNKFKEIKPHLEHFAGSQHIPDVAKVRFDKEHDFDSGLNKLKEAESAYNNKLKSNTNIVKPTPTTKKILDVGNGMAWYSLGAPACEAEGKAMGHCGNVPSQEDHHDVLSLRSVHNINGEEYHEPHLTFINDVRYNNLGEMKGRGNEKPAEKYHPAIVKLLNQGYYPAGGGYAPEDNFDLNHLSEAHKKNLTHLPLLDVNILANSDHSADPFVRRGMAKNPNLHPSLHEKLANDEDWSVRLEMARNPNLHPSLHEKLANGKDVSTRKAIASNPNLHPSLHEKLANHKDRYVRQGMASNPNLHPQFHEKLANDEDYIVRLEMASNPNLHPSLHEKLANDEDMQVRLEIAKRADLRPSLHGKLARDEHNWVRSEIARRPDLRPSLHGKLARDKDSLVRSRIASNPNLHPSLHEKLANDKHDQVREAIASNPNLHPSLHEKLANDKDVSTREAMAKNPNLHPSLHEKLANDEYGAVRRGMAKNPNLHPQFHEKLANDEREHVREAMLNNPNYVGNIKKSEQSTLQKMSRPRLQFPNLNIPTRLDQEIKPIGTERQKNIHARSVAETATRTAPSVQKITDPKRRQAVIEDARKDVVKQVKGSFGRGGTMGHIIPVAGKQYGAALVGKEYSKYDPALKEVAKEKEAAKLGEYKDKYNKWKQELQSKPQGSTDYWNHLANKPKEPRKSPIPKTDTKKLSPEAQIARGKAQEMITEHEAAHMAFGHIKNKYPEKYQGIMRHLMGSFSPEVQNALINATAKRYNPKSPHFYEEVVNHARDILVDQRMRDNFLRNTKGDQKLISGVKQGWNEAVKRAKKLTPEFGKSELNKAPKERLSGITTGKLKQLTEDHYHNPDTGLELVPEAVHQEIARRAENKAPKMIADYKRKLKPQKPSGENPEDWFGKRLEKALPTAPKVNLNPEHGKIIANAYENMKHEPNNPHVKAAYNALAHETAKQYQNLLNQGYKFSPMRQGMEDPYKTSKDMHADIANNKHLWYFPTEQGYGSKKDAPSDHPLLAPSKFKDKNGKVMPHNDVFRAVHDIMGHHLGGQSGFGPKGEHQAYLTHKKTYSPLAQKALASETLMQNSWVNFGPHAAHNRANPQNTIFADQKAGLPPDNIINGRWHE